MLAFALRSVGGRARGHHELAHRAGRVGSLTDAVSGRPRADAGERSTRRGSPAPPADGGAASSAGGARQPAGQGQESPAQGAGGAGGPVAEAEHAGPAQQLVAERGDDGQRGVGEEAAGGQVPSVSDGEVDDGALAMLGVER